MQSVRDPLSVIRDAGGRATTARLTANGVPRRAIATAVREGRILRPREGIYLDPAVGRDAVHAEQHGGRLACLSAARALGLWTLDDRRLHVGMTPGRHVREADGCSPVVHWHAEPGMTRPLIVSAFLALVQIAGCAGAEQLIVALDSALRLGRIPMDALEDLASAVPPALRRVVGAATPLADSGLESLVRWRLLSLGIVALPQHHVPGVGHVDLLVGDRLIIELDGGTHDGPEQRRRDAHRDVAATALGFLVLRLDYRQVVHHWPDVESAILTMVANGAHLDRQ